MTSLCFDSRAQHRPPFADTDRQERVSTEKAAKLPLDFGTGRGECRPGRRRRAPSAGTTAPPVSRYVDVTAVGVRRSNSIPPDSCRGWSRNRVARIRAQRELVCFAGEHRHRLPLTRTGLLMIRYRMYQETRTSATESTTIILVQLQTHPVSSAGAWRAADDRRSRSRLNQSSVSSSTSGSAVGFGVIAMRSMRYGRMAMHRAWTLNVSRGLSSLSVHSSRTMRPSTSRRMPFW
jgi:hypothetical protein